MNNLFYECIMSNISDYLDNSSKISFQSLINCDTLADCRFYTDIMLDCLIDIINIQPDNQQHLVIRRQDMIDDAQTLFQMFYIKCISIRGLLNGYGHENNTRVIIDYISLLSLVRTLYETFCAFELIFVYPDTDDKRLILYDLFLIQGLNERQQFGDSENCYVEQRKNEALTILNAQQEIFDSGLYSALSKDNKNKLENLAKNHPTYWRYFDKDNNIITFERNTSYMIFNIKKDPFKDRYRYMSLYTHPSYLSISQYKYIYRFSNNEDDTFVAVSIHDVLVLMSFLITDYCKLFPECKKVLDNLDPKHRKLITYYNDYYRN